MTSVYISKRQSDFGISRGFCFHENSFRENKTFAKIFEFTENDSKFHSKILFDLENSL